MVEGKGSLDIRLGVRKVNSWLYLISVTLLAKLTDAVRARGGHTEAVYDPTIEGIAELYRDLL